MMFGFNCRGSKPQNNPVCPPSGSSENEQQSPNPRLPHQRKSPPLWFLLLFAITFSGVTAGFYSAFTSAGNMGQAAEDQLYAIKTHQMTKAYYGYTSKEFQHATSLDAFRKYVKAHPVLIDNSEVVFYNRSLDEQIATLDGMVTAHNGTSIPIRYQMVQEGGDWKILNMELGKDTTTTPMVPHTPIDQALTHPIEAQLQAIYNGNYDHAYHDFTAADFKSATAMDQFEAFIAHYPILTQFDSLSFSTHEVVDDRAHVVVFLESDHGAMPAEYTLVKENGDWKVWSFHLLLMPQAEEDETAVNSQQLVAPINRQLAILRNGTVDQAYNETSSGFRLATTLDDFKAFIAEFPILTEGTVTIKDHYFEDGVGTVHVLLDQAEGSSVAEYTLTKEEGRWKIWGLRIARLPQPTSSLAATPTPSLDESELLAPIQAQITAIRNGNYIKAYSDYTSTTFRQVTSQEEFDRFLKNHPIFHANRSAQFDDVAFDNNVAIYTGMLTAEDGNSVPVEFDLIKEEGRWKVLSIKVLGDTPNSNAQVDPSQPIEFTQLQIGTEVDLAGQILKPAIAFSGDVKDIYATLYISNGTGGDTIEVIFEHVPSGSQIPPVSALLDHDGGNVLSFIFTPPVSGWPNGNYVIRVSSASGTTKAFPFSIRD